MTSLNFHDTLFAKNFIRILKIEDSTIDYLDDEFIQIAFNVAMIIVNT